MHEGRIFFFFFLLFAKVTFQQQFYAVKMFSTREDLTGFSESQSQEAQALLLVECFFKKNFVGGGGGEGIKSNNNNNKKDTQVSFGGWLLLSGQGPVPLAQGAL